MYKLDFSSFNLLRLLSYVELCRQIGSMLKYIHWSFDGRGCCRSCGDAVAVDISGWGADECVKCHAFEVRMVGAGGGMHTELNCVDCHREHPPETEALTLGCVVCHDGQLHFTIGSCRGCHADPHRPLISLRDISRPARTECLSCHTKVGEKMQQSPDSHAELFCTRCHPRHKEVPSCLDCHSPHDQHQVADDCSGCHPAHAPGTVVFKGYVNALFCRSCHKEQADALAETRTNHAGLSCLHCHNSFHANIPECRDCHGLPHARDLHSQFRNCLECHKDAHKLISQR